MIQIEKYSDEANARRSLELLGVKEEIPVGRTQPELPISREARQKQFETMMAKMAGINPVKTGAN